MPSAKPPRKQRQQAAQPDPSAVPAGKLRNRVIERRKMLGADLQPNGRNWRKHPDTQASALRGILEEVGQVGELYAYHSERNGGKLTLIDGHLRSKEFAGEAWDVAITDLTDAEADKLLAVYDPLAAMAEADKATLDALLRDVQTGSDALAGMLTELAEANKIIPAETVAPPEDFKEVDESIKTDHKCPKCGYAWSGGE